MLRTTFAAIGAVLAFSVSADAQIDSEAKVHAQLIAENGSVAPGGTVTVALEENIRDGWHTYWVNPGDAGAPTTIDWTLPAGWNAGSISWPYPKKLPVGPLMDYGYEGKAWLLMPVTAPQNAVPGQTVSLKAAANWLVCKEVCIPEEATLTLPLRVDLHSAPVDKQTAAQFSAARAKVPAPSPWPMRYRLTDALDLFVAAPALASARPQAAEFFPLRPGEVRSTAPQTLGFARDGIVLRLRPSKKFRAGTPLDGVLVLTSADGSVQALISSARAGSVPETQFMNGPGMTLALALLLALAGGLILNLMPCVLPVLAMKAVALAGQSGATRGAARSEGLAYGSGAILSFVALGAVLVALRAGGAAIGWGFQLQEPIVVGAFALLMFAVGLNLSGVFEVSSVSIGDALTRHAGPAGSFFTGVLAVAVAAPCTAPFMAAALGYGLTQTAPIALAIFAVLGLGFAAPFILLGFWPALQRRLPRPGPWMVRLRQALAFPMYGTAAWLAWVLGLQTSATGVGLLLAAMIVLAFSAWLWTATRPLAPGARRLGSTASLLALVAAASFLILLRSPSADGHAATKAGALSSIPSQPYSAARLDQLRVARQPVFVDATAAWCITCLVNDERVLSDPKVRDAFGTRHVAYLIADWTNRNAEITALLQAHGRSGVPLYLYYPPGAADAQVLPQVLTVGEVLSAINGTDQS